MGKGSGLELFPLLNALGIKCDECDAKEQLRNNMKRHMQLFMGGNRGQTFSAVMYLVYYLQHENLWSEAY